MWWFRKSTRELLEEIMATQQELSDKLDAIPPILDAIVADEQVLKDEIKALKDQLAAGTPVTQEQLDSLDAKAAGVLSRLQGIDASV
jgi:hypothetical protein